MPDIVERLRSRANTSGDVYYAVDADLMVEAADEIERLVAENERLRGHIYASNRPQPEEIERLTAALDDECAAHRICVEMRDLAYAALRQIADEDIHADLKDAINKALESVAVEPVASAGKSE